MPIPCFTCPPALLTRVLLHCTLQVKAPAKRAELQARLVRVDQQLRNEAARRRKEAFERDLKVLRGGGVAGGVGGQPGVVRAAFQRVLAVGCKASWGSSQCRMRGVVSGWAQTCASPWVQCGSLAELGRCWGP